MLSLLLLLSCHSAACPDGFVMAYSAAGAFCIQPYEVRFEGQLGNADQGRDWPDGSTLPTALHSAAGLHPTEHLSWYQAAAACKAMGWRLCRSDEWEDACDGQPGPGGAEHPTLDGRISSEICAIRRFTDHHAFETGQFADCRTATGIYDLEGNLWEWTDPGRVDDAGRPLIDKRGGGYYSGEWAPCSKAAVGTHPPSFNGTIGFRCCTDPR